MFSQSRSLVELPERLSQVRNLHPKHLWLGMDWGTRSPSAVVLMFRAPEQMQLGNRLDRCRVSVVVVDEVYTCTKTADGQRLWNTGDRSLTVTKFKDLVHDLCVRNGVAFDKIPKRHRVADAAVGADLGSDYGSLGVQLRKAGAGFVAGPKARRAEGWQQMRTLMEAAADPYAPGLYISAKCESLWQLLPRLTYSDTNPEDLDTTQPDHSADALRYALTAMEDPRYRTVGGRSTKVRVW